MELQNEFDFFDNDFSIKKPIRLIELFAGYGSQSLALERMGVNFESYKAVEFDYHACNLYNVVHKTNFPVMDITKIHGNDLEIVNRDKFEYIMFYSFPCFTADTLILTNKGYKKIINVQIGDYVLTHTNSWQKVTNFFDNGKKDVYKIHAMPFDTLECTKNHRFYVREMFRTYPTYKNGKRGNIRHFKNPVWKECKDLTKKDYVGIAINQKSEIPEWNGIEVEWNDRNRVEEKNELSMLLDKKCFWWLMGYYLGDGWERSQSGIILAANEKKLEKLKPVLSECHFNYTICKERTVYKVHISFKEIGEFVKIFGKYAYGKKVPVEVMNLPVDLLESFLEGYFSADGCYIRGKYKATSVSKELIYGIGQCVAKVYKTPYSIYRTKRNETTVIEGRTVHQRDTYDITFKKQKCKQDKAFYEDGYIWCPIYNIEKLDVQNVYDIEVENDHSFTANGIIAHNCTDLSVAGKQTGMKKGSGTRSSLLFEVERLLLELDADNHNLPQILIMENVTQVHSKKNMPDFQEWINALNKLGYTSFYQDLNSKNYGVPQNRDRTFMVSILGNYSFTFPDPMPLRYCMADILEDEVDEKYFLKNEKADKLIEQLIVDNKIPDLKNE